jgi:hypothetical protein
MSEIKTEPASFDYILNEREGFLLKLRFAREVTNAELNKFMEQVEKIRHVLRTTEFSHRSPTKPGSFVCEFLIVFRNVKSTDEIPSFIHDFGKIDPNWDLRTDPKAKSVWDHLKNSV